MQHIEKLGIKREVRNWIASTGRGKVQALNTGVSVSFISQVRGSL